MNISNAKLIPGDCILSTGTGFLSAAIRFFTSLHTKGAVFSHVACYIGNGYCIESLNKTKITKLKHYNNPKIKLKVYRVGLSNAQRSEFVTQAYAITNRVYGWTKLPLFALDAITTALFTAFGREKPVFFFTKHFGVFHIPVCSQLYVYLLHKVGFHLLNTKYMEVSWRIVQPDYLDDLLNYPMNHPQVIYQQNV